MIINRLRDSKVIGNGGFVISIFYIILAFLTRGLFDTTAPIFNSTSILFIPIILAYILIGRSAYNLNFDLKKPWNSGKRIFILLIIGSCFLLSSQILFNVQEFGEILLLEYLGIVLMILHCFVIATAFFFLYNQLKEFYIDGYIIKNPNYMLSIAYLIQMTGYIFFLIGWIIPQNSAGTINLIGIIISAVSIILIIAGAIPLNISFRAYPYLVENESLRSKKNTRR